LALEQGRFGHGAPAARLVAGLADGRVESPGETRARRLFRVLGLPEPQLQAWIVGADGVAVGRVDFLVAQQRTVVEFDGLVKYEGYDGRAAPAQEKRREDRLRALGYQVVRLTWADLADPQRVKAMLEQAFARQHLSG
jgi:hypothetical protein